MNIYTNKPDPFFEGRIIIHDLSSSPKLCGLDVGYERGEWRYNDFAEYLFEWLPEFALKYTDLTKINSATAMAFIKKAARTVYNTDKYKKRGEFGELLLHAIIRELFNSQPIISKLYYKSSINETIKGFDAVHIVDNGGELELWLGEVKFYKDISKAIASVIKELQQHIQNDYLKSEFFLITTKIDDQWAYAKRIKKLLSVRTGLDEVFKRLCVPVLLTYESETVRQHNSISNEFKEQLLNEFSNHYQAFCKRLPMEKLNIHLLLLPLKDKDTLLKVLHKRLEGMQR